jgi:hypothetical protein
MTTGILTSRNGSACDIEYVCEYLNVNVLWDFNQGYTQSSGSNQVFNKQIQILKKPADCFKGLFDINITGKCLYIILLNSKAHSHIRFTRKSAVHIGESCFY